MDDICRLCCSKNFVNNRIFDEENALYLKMSLYLPIKVFKNDQLPQKVCDKCSCKVNDFYQFCNETIEVQNRLRSYLISSGITTDEVVDLTRIKENLSPVPTDNVREQSTQTEWDTSDIFNTTHNQNIQIKEEPQTLSPIKEESIYDDYMDTFSDNSDNISLITLKKKKRSKKSENGVAKKTRKKKSKIEILVNSLPEGTNLSLVESQAPVKQELSELLKPNEIKEFDVSLDVKHVKKELGDLEAFNCCICMMQCFSKNEMIRHYRSHAQDGALPAEPPPAPAAPDLDPLRCLRCRKALTVGEWAAHWRRHWERDRRPYRCTLCEKTFRDPHQTFKHGLTHKYSEEGGAGGEAAEGGGGGEAPNKRFICDLCPESFVYMRYVPAGAPHARAPRGGGARAAAALRGVRATVRAPQLAAETPARARRHARPPLQRVREGALLQGTPQVPHPDTHGIQAQCLQDVRQGVREEVQPDAARARALGREAARVRVLRQGVQPALHARHPRAVPLGRAPLLLPALRPRVRGQGAALHASQDHLHLTILYYWSFTDAQTDRTN